MKSSVAYEPLESLEPPGAVAAAAAAAPDDEEDSDGRKIADAVAASVSALGDGGEPESAESAAPPPRAQGWRARVVEHFFPPDAPAATQLWRRENIAVPLCYLFVGLMQGLSAGVMSVYALEIGATEAQQTTLKVLRGLPASFKVLIGFLSDTTPLFGYRRKGYMSLAWTLSAVAMMAIFVHTAQPPSVPVLALLFFAFSMGFWFADVMADSLVAEKAKLESEQRRGRLQSTCYACRFFMLMVAAAFATFAYDALTPRFMFLLMGISPALIFPALYLLREERDVHVPPVREQCRTLWDTLCLRAVWQPMAFVYVFNTLQMGNAAWTQYLYTSLHFTPLQINSMVVVAYVLLYAGVMLYKTYMIDWSWRSVYVLCVALGVVISAGQVVLLRGWNAALGVSNYLFALGDEAFGEFVLGIQFLPTTIMMVNLCPAGSEGVSYAMFTSANNTALLVASSLSTLLLGIWDVSKAALEKMQLSGMLRLTVLTTALQTSGVLFVWMLPPTREALFALNELSPPSKLMGGVLLSTVVIGLMWAVVDSLLNILAPNVAGIS